MTREVVFAPEAFEDLRKLYDDIALDAGVGRAQSYTDRIAAHCINLVTFPERGTRRDDLNLDAMKEVEFREYVLQCTGLPPAPPPGSFVGLAIGVSTGAKCKIIRRR